MKNSTVSNTIVFVTAFTVSQLLSGSALGGTSQNTTSSVTPAQGNLPAITISYSGQTALRNFLKAPGISTLQPGGSITFNYGPTGSVPVTYWAPPVNDPLAYVQLAPSNFTGNDTSYAGVLGNATAPSVQSHSALRLEWHEQGSVQGQIDLINDQIGYVSSDGGATGYLSNLASRGPSTSNPTWINGNSFTGAGALNGFSIAAANYANTYDTSVYDRASGRNRSSGTFLGQNGQDRIQFAVGEYKTEGLSKPGTPSPFAVPGTPGYGLGNPRLNAAANIIGIGVKGGRQQFYPESIANQSTDKVDPNSETGQHYTDGPWATAGANNIDSRQYAVTAVTYSANPGTGLSRINKGDAQWLLTAGRLGNGADFNVVIRANDAGQRIVPAVNVGVDPSWAVGENDDGNTSGTAATNIQKTLGAGIRFSGKTAGGESRNAIAQSRLGFGPLSLAEARGAASSAPVRTLDVDFEHLTDTGNAADFKRPTFDNIANFSYKAVLVTHFNTIKKARPDLLAAYLSSNPGASQAQIQTWWNNLSSDVTNGGTGIKGDQFNNVNAFLKNVTNSVGTAASGTITVASANNPADALFSEGYLIPGLLDYTREFDGGPLTPQNLTPDQLAVRENVKTFFGPKFTAEGTAGSNGQTTGSSAYYGALNAGTVVLNGNTVSSAINGGTTSVSITAKNFLFGNFNQNNRRDYGSVKEAVNAALSLRAIDATGVNGVNAFSSIYTAAGGVSNATLVPSLNGTPAWESNGADRKGDLIILGDFNSDAAFDGADLYLLARGASLSDNAGTTELTGNFADRLRDPNARLNKNKALDWINAYLNGSATLNGGTNSASADAIAFIRKTASANLANDPTGINAFNKFDTNRDGLVSRKDAAIVDKFVGNSYHNLDQSLAATIANDGSVNPALPQVPISLVDAELTDDGGITSIGASSDFGLIRSALGASLLDGDADFSGTVDSIDLTSLLASYGASGKKWSNGDFTLDGKVNTVDFNLLAGNFGLSAAPLLGSVVPEPAAATSFAIVALMFRRRR